MIMIMLILKRLNSPGDKCLRDPRGEGLEGGAVRGLIKEVRSLGDAKWPLGMV